MTKSMFSSKIYVSLLFSTLAIFSSIIPAEEPNLITDQKELRKMIEDFWQTDLAQSFFNSELKKDCIIDWKKEAPDLPKNFIMEDQIKIPAGITIREFYNALVNRFQDGIITMKKAEDLMRDDTYYETKYDNQNFPLSLKSQLFRLMYNDSQYNQFIPKTKIAFREMTDDIIPWFLKKSVSKESEKRNLPPQVKGKNSYADPEVAASQAKTVCDMIEILKIAQQS